LEEGELRDHACRICGLWIDLDVYRPGMVALTADVDDLSEGSPRPDRMTRGGTVETVYGRQHHTSDRHVRKLISSRDTASAQFLTKPLRISSPYNARPVLPGRRNSASSNRRSSASICSKRAVSSARLLGRITSRALNSSAIRCLRYSLCLNVSSSCESGGLRSGVGMCRTVPTHDGVRCTPLHTKQRRPGSTKPRRADGARCASL
jgi:hypothetical protein